MSYLAVKPHEWFETHTDLRDSFLALHGWRSAELEKVGEDSAFRRYFRLRSSSGDSMILMESIPDGHEIATPGHSLKDFIRISAYLRSIGVSAPQVHSTDEHNGYLLIEDFGSLSFKGAQEQGIAGRDDLYALATDVLSWVRQNAHASDIVLPNYYSSHVHTGCRRVIDWYVPTIRRQRNPDGLVESYLAVWNEIERSLPSVPLGFLHVDYHFENLMWVNRKSGIGRCGVLDFQGAMIGPAPYDLANLLEDARVDVPADLRQRMMRRYCQTMSPEDEEVFQSWYRVLATQFHCRVIGQFIRLAVRDNKTRYLSMIPRVALYLREGLKNPVLRPLERWFAVQKIDFLITDGFSAEAISPHIRSDAF